MITEKQQAERWYCEQHNTYELKMHYYPEHPKYKPLSNKQILDIWRLETGNKGPIYSEEEVITILSGGIWKAVSIGMGKETNCLVYARKFLKEYKKIAK